MNCNSKTIFKQALHSRSHGRTWNKYLKDGLFVDRVGRRPTSTYRLHNLDYRSSWSAVILLYPVWCTFCADAQYAIMRSWMGDLLGGDQPHHFEVHHPDQWRGVILQPSGLCFCQKLAKQMHFPPRVHLLKMILTHVINSVPRWLQTCSLTSGWHMKHRGEQWGNHPVICFQDTCPLFNRSWAQVAVIVN